MTVCWNERRGLGGGGRGGHTLGGGGPATRRRGTIYGSHCLFAAGFAEKSPSPRGEAGDVCLAESETAAGAVPRRLRVPVQDKVIIRLLRYRGLTN